MLSNLKWLSIKQRIMFVTAVLVFKMMHSKKKQFRPTCLTVWSLIHISRPTVQGDPPPGTLLYPVYTQIRSLQKALDSGISHQHPFELSQTSRHTKKPQLSSLHIISTSTYQHDISHIHKHLDNKSAWLHIGAYHPTT